MQGPRSYRVVSVLGTVVLSTSVLLLSGTPQVTQLAAQVPVLSNLPTQPATLDEYVFETLTAVTMITLSFMPLYKPRPRRVIDTVLLAGRRTILAVVILAAIGYFDYTYRIPRLTVVVATLFLLAALPLWFVSIRRRSTNRNINTILVGDDPEQLRLLDEIIDETVIGYVSPSDIRAELERSRAELTSSTATDGGVRIGREGCLGGFSRLDEVLVEQNVDTVVLAFRNTESEEFFGFLDTCYNHGVNAQIHRNYADSVLTDDVSSRKVVDITLEPWDWQDRALKRLFDILFATSGIVLMSPLALVIAVAIKLNDGGPVFYIQERTGQLGETFLVYKFRTMRPGNGDSEPGNSDDRITRVGQSLRELHLDEIPQLFSILSGKMSTFGPRAAWVK